MSDHRYAIFYAPAAGSPLARFGNRWLGRDPDSGAALEQYPVPGLRREEVAEITADPCRYGFHGTLKPPFTLAAGATPGMLHQAVLDFAANRARFDTPPPMLTTLSGFLALVPVGPAAPIEALAADCVAAFDGFRTPPDESELARRRRSGLSERQEQLLQRWGYPYVMEEFRFHLTLTRRLDDARRDTVAAALAPLVAPFRAAPVTMDGICIFEQADREAPFRLIRRCPFGGP